MLFVMVMVMVMGFDTKLIELSWVKGTPRMQSVVCK